MREEITGNRYLNSRSEVLTLKNLHGINILFGKNGTGKSSFLRDIYQKNDQEYHLIIPERGGFEMSYNASYAEQESNNQQKKEHRQKNYDPSYKTRAISRTSIILNKGGYLYFSGKVESKIHFDDITNLFRLFLPDFKVQFKEDVPYNLEIYKEDDNQDESSINTADRLSSGQAEALSLAADIITQAVLWENDEKTILIDEPDSHLHIDLENRFAIFIEEIRKKFNVQVIIATHSYSLLASLLNVSSDLGIVCFDTNRDVISTIPLDQEKYLTNLLNIDLSLAVILNRKVLIVEGNDDFLVWNQAIRSHKFDDLALIQCNGSDILQYKKTAEKILSVVLDSHEKLGLTLLDGDNKGTPETSEHDILPTFRLHCYSIENLFLTDEVINYINEDLDLNKALQELLEQVENENFKETIKDLINDKRNIKIPKELIYIISKKIDSYSSSRDWRIILGKVLGKDRPQGELEEFLGSKLVKYIWGEQ